MNNRALVELVVVAAVIVVLLPLFATVDKDLRSRDNRGEMRKGLMRSRTGVPAARSVRGGVTSRPAAWTLTVALAVSLLATCIPVEAATAAQQVCCAAMNHDCGPAAEGQDCCASERAQVENFTVASRVSLPAPPVFSLFHALIAHPLRPASGSSSFAFDRISRLSPPGVPRYLLTATLLI